MRDIGRWTGGLIGATVLGALVVAGPSARAQTLPDPLHGFCNGGSPAGACVDNGTNTPLGNSTTFGFTISPGPQTGDLTLAVLVPSNESFSGSITELTPTSQTVGLTEHTGVWNSGNLADFLSINASPDNSIGAYLPSTQFLDPSAAGYDVFLANMGTTTIDANGGTSPSFDVPAGLPLGSYIVAFCAGATAGKDCTVGNSLTEVATANSGALFDNGTHIVPVPEPSSIAILGAALIGLGALRRRRRKI